VAVRVITFDAFTKPEDFPDSEEIPKLRFNLLAPQLRIAVLLSKHDSLVSRAPAPFTSIDRLRESCAGKKPNLENFGDTVGTTSSRSHGGYLPPQAIVVPIDDRQPRLVFARHENRPVIAAPRFVGWDATEMIRE